MYPNRSLIFQFVCSSIREAPHLWGIAGAQGVTHILAQLPAGQMVVVLSLEKSVKGLEKLFVCWGVCFYRFVPRSKKLNLCTLGVLTHLLLNILIRRSPAYSRKTNLVCLGEKRPFIQTVGLLLFVQNFTVFDIVYNCFMIFHNYVGFSFNQQKRVKPS